MKSAASAGGGMRLVHKCIIHGPIPEQALIKEGMKWFCPRCRRPVVARMVTGNASCNEEAFREDRVYPR